MVIDHRGFPCTSFREACSSTQGPGIQAFGVMPWEVVFAGSAGKAPVSVSTVFWFDRLHSGAAGVETPTPE